MNDFYSGWYPCRPVEHSSGGSNAEHRTNAENKLTNEIIWFFEIVFRYLSKYINRVKDIFKALNDNTRREILDMLKEKSLTAGEISEQFNISKPSISHHLDLLKRADLVSSIKKGQFVYYTINTTVLEDVMTWLITLNQKK